MPAPDITENYIRIRVRDPNDFEKDSFRTIWISKDKGIKAVIGKLKGEDKTTIQSYLFDKNKWTVEEAQNWVEGHKSIRRPMTKILKQSTGLKNLYPDVPEFTLFAPDAIKAEETSSGEFLIQGWASTPDKDSYGDIVEPEAFYDGLERFASNPVMFLNHNGWGNLWGDAKPPIGKWTVWNPVSGRGLWVEGYISKTAPDVRILVEEGILKGLSIGFDVNDKDVIYDEELKANRIKKLQLYEISLVGMPANPNTLAGPVKQAYETVKVKYFISPKTENENKNKSLINKEDATMSDVKVNDDQLKTGFAELDKKMEAITKEIKAVREAADGKTEAEKNHIIELVEQQTKLAEQVQELQDLRRKVGIDDRPRLFGTQDAGEPVLNAIKPTIKTLINMPCKQAHRVGLSPDHLKTIQQTQDELYVVQQIAKHFRQEGLASDAAEKVLARKREEFSKLTKAMDTATSGEGAEWIPTGFSNQLIEYMSVYGGVIPLFNSITMPTNPYKKPSITAGFTTYKVAEPTTDTAAKVPVSNLTTAQVTYDAFTNAGRAIYSYEMGEDSIIAMATTIPQELAKALVKAQEDCTINGDETSTHMDGATTNLDANDRRRLFYGLRYWGIVGAVATYDTTETTYGTAAYEASDIIYTLKAMGKYGINPAELAFIVSPKGWLKTMLIDTFWDMTKVSTDAYWLKGYMSALAGSPLVISEFVPDTAEDTGKITDGDGGLTMLIAVHRPSHEYGRMRNVTLEVARDIETLQMKIVGSQRVDMQKLAATAQTTVGIGLAITA